VGRLEQLLINRKCLPRDKQNLRYDASGKERDAHCVPDMRYFASALAATASEAETDPWQAVRVG